MEASTDPGRSSVGIEALELFVSVLSQSEATAPSGDAVYDRLCEAVCRLARMRRAIIFRYDPARRRVRAAGAYGLDLEQFAEAYVTVESAPIAARALREDRVVEIAGDVSDQFPSEYAGLFPEPVRLVCAPMSAAGWAVGVMLADRLLPAAELSDADRYLLWTLGKTAALASVARIVATQAETARQLEQRIDLAREIHEGVIQRLFGVSMALDGEGDLPGDARKRCASETQAALVDLRAALQRPLGRAPRATQTTFAEEVKRLARMHPELGLRSSGAPMTRSPGAGAACPVGAGRGRAQRPQARHPDQGRGPGRPARRRVRAGGLQRRRQRAPAPTWDGAAARRARGIAAAGA